MKTKKIILSVYLASFAFFVYAQRVDVPQVFVATSEEEMYKLYDQMLDSARLSNRFLYPGNVERFSFGFFYEFEDRDTILKLVQRCEWKRDDEYICSRSYRGYISNSLSIDFYGRIFNYLKQLDVIENYYIKDDINQLLTPISNIIIKQYESGELNEEDNIKARLLIEETMLRIINGDHNYRGLISYHNYITDNIRKALVDVIENPFYPKEYLDFYMSRQNTSSIDTIGIPESTKEKVLKNRLYSLTEKELKDHLRLSSFLFYQELGKEWGGLSAKEAYLERKRREFYQKGYLPIRDIEEYAHQKDDGLLIKHLKEFKKKYPDYPLKYF